MPDFYRLNEGTHQLDITEAEAKEAQYHWVDGKTATCAGPACQRCKQGNKARTRYTFGVNVGGAAWLVRLPDIAYAELRKAVGQHGSLLGLRVVVETRGSGAARRYKFRMVGPGASGDGRGPGAGAGAGVPSPLVKEALAGYGAGLVVTKDGDVVGLEALTLRALVHLLGLVQGAIRDHEDLPF